MKNIIQLFQVFVLVASLMFTKAVVAHGDEVHGTPSENQGSASPRFEAHSELFEIVAVYDKEKNKDRLVVYLDKYATNEPIRDAQIEVEAIASIDGKIVTNKIKAFPLADGSFEIKSTDFSKASEWAMTFTVLAGAESDLLDGKLVVTDQEKKSSTTAVHATKGEEGVLSHLPFGLSPKSLSAFGASFVLLLVGLLWLRRSKTRRGHSSTLNSLATLWAAGSATLIAISTAFSPSHVWAGGDHSHDKPTINAASNAPKRNSDGSVFFPKTSQRELEIRTSTVQTTDVAKSFELNGKVLADPSAGGKVQTAAGGRLEIEGRALPRLGQTVRKGELLASVRPTVATIERANQAAAAAEAKTNLELAKRRLARLEQLEGSVAQRDIDLARGEVSLLAQREQIIRESLRSVERLTAPVSGIIASVNVVAGQVLAANDTLFEVIDPTRLYIEALVYDVAATAKLEPTAFTSMAGKAISLAYIGAGRVLKEQALPLQFRVVASQDSALFSIGQPVTVKVKSAETIKAISLSAASIVKNPSNQDIVWVHTSAEIFTPKTIRWQSIDGATIAVTQGLAKGDRVVVRSASLLNQVR
jgi:membrane fusion protein, heavy metal efflux system